MVEKKEKTLSYRRAEWLQGIQTLKLESLLKQVFTKLKEVSERTVVQDGHEMKVASYKKGPSDDGILLHITSDTPGAETTVVPNSNPGSDEIIVVTANPPDKTEFMNGDAFLYVKDNHVTLCSSGLRDGAIRFFLHALLRKAKVHKDADKFDLMKGGDAKKVQMIRRVGVKEIELRASLYQATVEYQKRKTQAQGFLGAVAKQIKAFLNKELDFTNDSLRIELTIKTDERFRNHLSLGEKRIGEMAEDVVNNQEDDDDYVIVLKDKQRIKANEIYLKSVVSIDIFGNSVNKEQAFSAVYSFYKELIRVGSIEQ